jgi:acylphosphatase
MVESWLLQVSGRVQGVGFREACIREARSRKITGWVRNRLDGSVELLIQGAAEQLGGMRAWLDDGAHPARVDRVDVTPQPPPFHRFDRFDRLPTV